MKNISKQLYTQEHPYPPYYPDKAKAIIIGTAPPYRFCKPSDAQHPLKPGDIDYFYGSVDNRLWYVIKRVFDEERLAWYRTKQHCKDVLKASDLAIADLYKKFNRRSIRADDNDLEVVEYNVGIINKILSNKCLISKLYFTSVFSYDEFIVMLNRNNQFRFQLLEPYEKIRIQISKGKVTKVFQIKVLPSPSGRGPSDDILVNEYKEAFKP